jgi:hypothetical protein
LGGGLDIGPVPRSAFRGGTAGGHPQFLRQPREEQSGRSAAEDEIRVGLFARGVVARLQTRWGGIGGDAFEICVCMMGVNDEK